MEGLLLMLQRLVPSERSLRIALGVLLAVIALNAFGGGVYGLAGAPGVPRTWLAGSPFATYFIPSVVLLVVVGGACLLAAIAVLDGWTRARLLALGAGAIVLGWLGVQVAIIGYVSWMQATTAAAGAVAVALALLCPSLPARRATR